MKHEVALFEAGSHLGGHTNTVQVAPFGSTLDVDTGFMVFNHRTYPNFVRILSLLGVPERDSDMSFSVRCERTGLEYQGGSLNGLFAQRSNLFRPGFYRMLADIVRFNRESLELLEGDDDHLTIGEYLEREGYGQRFIEHYLIPMGAAIWSSRPQKFQDFPARFLVAFLHNHGLLQIRDRPVWKTIPGGAKRYVEELVRPLGNRLRLNAPIERVRPKEDGVLVLPQGGPEESFDHVVLATHADQTLRLLEEPTTAEQEILGAFPYQKNECVLHTDSSLLPRQRRAWASWNYHIPAADGQPVALTYDVNRLQGLGAPQPVCVTLNNTGNIHEKHVLREITYHHPVFTPGVIAAQRRHDEINGKRRLSFCGAYWGYGFHEDGVNSALAVCKHFGIGLDQWKAASTKDESVTLASAQ